MKFKAKLLVLFFGVLMLSNVTYAESPREQLKQMVEQLQKSPTDNTLREKIIKLAQEVKPAPSVPEEAIKYEGRGQFRFNKAKSEQDYVAAAKEYEQAVQLAPWVPGYYSDLCTIYEKAEKFVDAKRNCEFALLSIADPAQITEIKRRIAGLEVGIETSSPAAIAERERKEGKELFRKNSGRRYMCVDGEVIQTTAGRTLYRLSIEIQVNGFKLLSGFKRPGSSTYEDGYPDSFENPVARRASRNSGSFMELAADGSYVIYGSVDNGREKIDYTCR